MTILISDNSPRISYTATAGQTVFTVPFEFFDNSDLNVFINDVLKTITTDYTVTGGDGSTGTVTLVTGATVGDSIVITRKVTLERVTDFPTSGPFQVASLNIELDKLVAMVADLQDLANRGLRLSDSDITERLTLASTNERKGTVLAFNATTGAVEVGPTIADTNTVAQIKADISTVAGISANVTTVAGISGNVTTVAGVSSDVTTVAGQTTNMQNITDNLTDIQNASTNATNAATSASNAASSETAAASSASSAATSEANAATSETNAATSASSAASSASTATTKASEAATSATNAATSETNAATSATNAATSETNAGNSAASALASEGSAAASASNAAISETNSATSATNASNSAISAANSAASAAAAFDNFDDTYLGSFATDPTTDNDGDPLVEGALYFNSTSNEMRVYDGANWIAASSSGTASMLEYNYTATASQTTFSGADDNSATLSYTADNIIVTLNGVVLENGTDYTATDGTSIVLTTGAALDDELNIIAFKSFTVSDTVAASTGGTFNGSVAVNGDLTVNTIGAGDAAFRFDPDNNCVRPHDASTNGATDNFLVLGASSNRFKDLYLGGGVFLGGTGDANKLDDYEEGTWTPTYTSSNPPTISYAVQNGEYVKIGRQVIARCEITTNSVSGGSGNVVSVGGLPFTANSSAGTRVGTAIIGYATAFSGDSPQAGYQNNNTTSFILGHNSTSTNANSSLSGTLAVTNLATGSNSNFLMATIIYTTT